MERPSSTETMLSSIPSIPLPLEDSPKHRCPTDNHVIFFYLESGMRYRCRHCKQLHVISWEEILQKYQETQQGKACTS